MTKIRLKYSVIVLLEEQHEDFAQLVQDLYDLFSSRGESFEILMVANGTGGFLRNILSKLNHCNDKLKAFELNTMTPQAVCLKAALKESAGEIILACGSYQQITYDSLIDCLNSMDDETDIISPWRQSRVDTLFNQFQSKVFNTVVSWVGRLDLHDLGCTVKVVRREVLQNTEFYGNMYQFLPILAHQKGYRTKEVKCEHYQQRGKTGFRNLSLLIPRMIDIFTLYFNTRFTRKPLRFFSAIGFLFLALGSLIVLSVFAQKFFFAHPIGGRPMLLLALLFIVLGVQAAGVGLLGEIIAFTHGRNNKQYSIEKII
jgi:hypothetical protein